MEKQLVTDDGFLTLAGLNLNDMTAYNLDQIRSLTIHVNLSHNNLSSL
jgi:hypothetical protein